ncbi:MAG: hypothetical protein LAT68_05430 [Cyclobacteriaceae bacterium]|nr:hypothetical protein [Cyclobacteriaceae bacterium]MCH8515752.1 hypothetical protein [Cyclobacteriaceae bacterium]
MLEYLKSISEEERDFVYSVPAKVTVLVAGSDNKIDHDELEAAISLSQMKKTTAREDLLEYYKHVSERFEADLQKELKYCPNSTEGRNEYYAEQLAKLNNIFPRLDTKFSIQLYASLKGFAKKVAESSGGVLGYMTISEDERRVIDLPMIQDPDLD